MEIILYILLFFLLIILLLLFIPINIVLSTDRGVISINYGNLFSAEVDYVNDDPKFIYRLLFWKKELSIIEHLACPSEAKNLDYKGSKGFSKSIVRRFRNRWRSILNSFKVKTLEVNIDTDDYILNAYLYPVFHFMSIRYQKLLSTNFNGINRVEIKIRNTLAELLYVMIK